MPFVTNYNFSQISKKIYGEIPEDIWKWNPYKKVIVFLNRLDKSILYYFKKFCENPNKTFNESFEPINKVDELKFVYEGVKPSYHKYETCPRLTNNFINFPIPEEIQKAGPDKVENYRTWFKKNRERFEEMPDYYQAMLYQEYGIYEYLHRVNYRNSGNRYQENLTREQIEKRIDQYLEKAKDYYFQDEDRKVFLKEYSRKTFLALKDKQIDTKKFNFSESEAKEILIEYYHLFIEPVMYYLKEYFKVTYSYDGSIHEKILEDLNFTRCSLCYAEDYLNHEPAPKFLEDLRGRFGPYQFPLESMKFCFEENPEKNKRIAFFFARVIKEIKDLEESKLYQVEYFNHKNELKYLFSNVSKNEAEQMVLYRYYLTKVIMEMGNNMDFELTSYAIEHPGNLGGV